MRSSIVVFFMISVHQGVLPFFFPSQWYTRFKYRVHYLNIAKIFYLMNTKQCQNKSSVSILFYNMFMPMFLQIWIGQFLRSFIDKSLESIIFFQRQCDESDSAYIKIVIIRHQWSISCRISIPCESIDPMHIQQTLGIISISFKMLCCTYLSTSKWFHTFMTKSLLMVSSPSFLLTNKRA